MQGLAKAHAAAENVSSNRKYETRHRHENVRSKETHRDHQRDHEAKVLEREFDLINMIIGFVVWGGRELDRARWYTPRSGHDGNAGRADGHGCLLAFESAG